MLALISAPSNLGLRPPQPGAAGVEVTVSDPDLDPDGRYAALLTGILTDGLEHLGRDYPR